MKRTKESEKPVFDIDDRGFNVKAWYLENTYISKGAVIILSEEDLPCDALIEVRYKDKILRSFEYPAYKIFNIAAHFSDIVDGELSKDDKERGYKIASWNGISGAVIILSEEDLPCTD